jgi:hypothetical protein
MSGGHFDYQQYHIEEIAEHLEKDIADIEYGKSIGTIKKKYVYCHLVDIYSGRKEWPNWIIDRCRYYDNCEDLLKFLKKEDGFYEKDGKFFLNYYGNTYEVIISEGESDEFADGKWHLDIEDKEVIEEFKNGLKILKTAAIYAQRIDWLLSGDDGEESFKERLKEELDKLESKPLVDYEYWKKIFEERDID